MLPLSFVESCRFNVEVTGAARLYRAASVWTAGLAFAGTFGTNCFMTTLKVEDPPENLLD